MFNTLTREGFFAQSNDDARNYNESVQKRFESIYKQQQDEEWLKQNALPKVCKGMDYTPPVVATHPGQAKHNNTFVITNNAHSKATNNGYSRGNYGGHFFCHWAQSTTTERECKLMTIV